MVTNICALVQCDFGGTNGTLHTCVAWKCHVIWDTCQRRDCCMHMCRCSREVKRTWDESAAWGALVGWLERRINRPQHLDEHKSKVSPTGADLSTDTIDLGLGLGNCAWVLSNARHVIGVIVHGGFLCVWMKKMNVAPSPDHLTQAVKLTAVCEARQSCYVLQLCLARSMPSHAIRMTL